MYDEEEVTELDPLEVHATGKRDHASLCGDPEWTFISKDHGDVTCVRCREILATDVESFDEAA